MPTDAKSLAGGSGVDSLLDRLLSRLPYSDGSTRRRMLAGVIVGLALWSAASPTNSISSLFTTNEVSGIFRYSLPSIATGICLYLLGTLVEIVGNVSLVRGAAGAVQATQAPVDHGQPPRHLKRAVVGYFGGLAVLPTVGESVYTLPPLVQFLIPDLWPSPWNGIQLMLASLLIGWPIVELLMWMLPRRPFGGVFFGNGWKVWSWISTINRYMLFVLFWPLRIMLATFRGLSGRTDYALGLGSRLSPQGHTTWMGLPERVALGLERPAGEYGELAIHFMVDQYEKPSNKRWVTRLVGRMRDVAIVVSAVVLAFIITIGSTFARTSTETNDDPESAEIDARESAEAALYEARAEVRRWEDRGVLRQTFSDTGPTGLFTPDLVEGVRQLEGTLARVKSEAERQRISGAVYEQDYAASRSAVEAAVKAITAHEAAKGAANLFRAQRLVTRLSLLLAFQLTLFLYLILFVTLRGAVESMIEALAIERAELAASANQVTSQAPAPVLTIASGTERSLS